jgi:predicted phosphoribosyltransferase
MLFEDRTDAGRRLAGRLGHLAGQRGLLVLGLPRGGVPVAAEVADVLGAELDVMVVRKLGLPGQPELAMGAIATGGVRVLNPSVLEAGRVSADTVEAVAEREGRELARRETRYRGDRPAPEIAGRTVVLVDDGMATGATMRAAVEAARALEAGRVIVAVPTASREARELLAEGADEVVCVDAPEPYYAVGYWYRRFDQTSDDEVARLLGEAATP